MVHWLFPPCLQFAGHHCRSFISTTSSHLARQTITLYGCLLDELQRPEPTTSLSALSTSYSDMQKQKEAELMPEAQTNNWLQSLLLFAIVWGIGGGLEKASQEKYVKVTHLVSPCLWVRHKGMWFEHSMWVERIGQRSVRKLNCVDEETVAVLIDQGPNYANLSLVLAWTVKKRDSIFDRLV